MKMVKINKVYFIWNLIKKLIAMKKIKQIEMNSYKLNNHRHYLQKVVCWEVK